MKLILNKIIKKKKITMRFFFRYFREEWNKLYDFRNHSWTVLEEQANFIRKQIFPVLSCSVHIYMFCACSKQVFFSSCTARVDKNIISDIMQIWFFLIEFFTELLFFFFFLPKFLRPTEFFLEIKKFKYGNLRFYIYLVWIFYFFVMICDLILWFLLLNFVGVYWLLPDHCVLGPYPDCFCKN